jgi:hypothetical protein
MVEILLRADHQGSARTAMIAALDAACREQAAGTGRFADGSPDTGMVGYWTERPD